MEKIWVNFSNQSFSSYGSSNSLVDEDIYLIGGNHQKNEVQNNLQVTIFNLKTMSWRTSVINTNGILNRSYHASSSIGSTIYTFGGATTLGNLDEIIEITKTLEEIKCSVAKFPNLSIIGLSASNFTIPILGERVFLYGGISNTGNYLSEVQIFESNENILKSKFTTLQTDLETPPPRAYHSAVVAGENKQLLIIHGGRGNSGLLNDIWILDTSPLHQLSSTESAPPVDSKSKGSKGGKGAVAATPLPFWSQVIFHSPHSPPSRCLHSSYVHSIEKRLFLHTFGGIGENGIYSINLLEIEIVHEAGNKYIEQSITLPSQQNATQRYGFTTCDIKENEKSVMLLVFGGVQLLHNNQSLQFPELIILDETANIAQHSKTLLPELLPQDDQSSNDTNVHIEYPAGDVYDGEVLRNENEMYRHGKGKMLYANGSTYEVSYHIKFFI